MLVAVAVVIVGATVLVAVIAAVVGFAVLAMAMILEFQEHELVAVVAVEVVAKLVAVVVVEVVLGWYLQQ